MYEDNFSKWLPWEERKNIPKKNCPGVYIAALSELNLSGTDFSWLEEIIYIGVTNSAGGLIGRLNQFHDTISGKRTSHGGADRVKYKHREYDILAPKLYVSVASFDCNVESKLPNDLRIMGKVLEFEFICFAEYAEKFSRLPEFNDMKASQKKFSKNPQI
jgi:hypothetical protein